MPSRDHGSLAVPFLMLIAFCVFLTGVGWGLPSRVADNFLFENRVPWTGEQILALAGDRGSEKLGADVDRDPQAVGDVLNDTDSERAQIVRRYRLFTYQPDEMITMMSIGGMRPGEWDFDPRLYQYGGLWIYPVAALIKLSGPVSSQAHYLDHPAEFGWFYVVARLYSAAWGILGVWIVHRLAQRCGAGLLGSVGAMLLFIFLPVVVNQAHEAKPHLPGAVLVLMAILFAGHFIERGTTRWWIATGIACGAAAGMILSAAVVFIILPAMVMLRAMSWQRRLGILAASALIGIAVYFVTNPYVAIHLLGDRQVLSSNLANSAAMYPVGTRLVEGTINAIFLLGEAAGPVTVLVGMIGAIVLVRSFIRQPAGVLRQGSEIMLLLIVSTVVLLQFILLAAGKPGEYARFAIVPAIALGLSAVIWIGQARIRTFEKVESIVLLLILVILPSVVYLRGYSEDGGTPTRRLEYARDLAGLRRMGAATLGVFNEPAPYLLPPVDLFAWKIKLLPDDYDFSANPLGVDVIVRPVDKLKTEQRSRGEYVLMSRRRFDDLFPSRISWAAKPLEIWVRGSLIDPPASRPNE